MSESVIICGYINRKAYGISDSKVYRWLDDGYILVAREEGSDPFTPMDSYVYRSRREALIALYRAVGVLHGFRTADGAPPPFVQQNTLFDTESDGAQASLF